MKIWHAKGYRGFWMVGLYLDGGDLIAGKDRRVGRWLQSTAQRSAMGDGGQLADVHGSSDSGHPETSQIRGNDLQTLAKSLGYQNGDGGHVGATIRGGAMAGGSGARCYDVLGHQMMI